MRETRESDIPDKQGVSPSPHRSVFEDKWRKKEWGLVCTVCVCLYGRFR